MTNKGKIKFLSQYVSILKEHQELLESYEYFKYKVMSIQSQVLSDMPKANGNNDKIGNGIAQLENLEVILKIKIDTLLQAREQTETAISLLEDSVHRRVLSLRYIHGLRWEEVAVKMNYAWAQVHRVHSNALNKIKIGPA